MADVGRVVDAHLVGEVDVAEDTGEAISDPDYGRVGHDGQGPRVSQRDVPPQQAGHLPDHPPAGLLAWAQANEQVEVAAVDGEAASSGPVGQQLTAGELASDHLREALQRLLQAIHLIL